MKNKQILKLLAVGLVTLAGPNIYSMEEAHEPKTTHKAPPSQGPTADEVTNPYAPETPSIVDRQELDLLGREYYLAYALSLLPHTERATNLNLQSIARATNKYSKDMLWQLVKDARVHAIMHAPSEAPFITIHNEDFDTPLFGTEFRPHEPAGERPYHLPSAAAAAKDQATAPASLLAKLEVPIDPLPEAQVERIINASPILLKEIMHEIEVPLKTPLVLRNTIMLSGPPGTGKTYLGIALGQKLERKIHLIKGPALLDSYQSSGHHNFHAIIEEIVNSNERSVIIIDEVSAMIDKYKSRDRDAGVVQGFWLELDACKKNPNIIFVFTSNYMDECPDALKSRIKVSFIEVPFTSEEIRRETIENFLLHIGGGDKDPKLGRLDASISKEYLDSFAKKTENMSFRDLEALITMAAGIAHYRNDSDLPTIHDMDTALERMQKTDEAITASQESQKEPRWQFALRHPLTSTLVGAAASGLTQAYFQKQSLAQQEKSYELQRESQRQGLELQKAGLDLQQSGLKLSEENACFKKEWEKDGGYETIKKIKTIIAAGDTIAVVAYKAPMIISTINTISHLGTSCACKASAKLISLGCNPTAAYFAVGTGCTAIAGLSGYGIYQAGKYTYKKVIHPFYTWMNKKV